MPDTPGQLVHRDFWNNHLVEIKDQGDYRSLYFGSHHLQSRMSLSRPQDLVLSYTGYMVLPLLMNKSLHRIMVIGIGSGSFVRFFQHHFKDCVIDAVDYAQAEQAVEQLHLHPFGAQIAQTLNLYLDRIMVYSLDYYQGLQRTTPEWCWRDFRLRLSHGRNHGSEQRLERAALLWAVYRNFTPAQQRYEYKRHYRHPGLSPLAVAGFPHQNISYLDALAV